MTRPTITLAPLPSYASYKVFLKPVVSAQNLNAQDRLSEMQKNGAALGKPLPLGYGLHQIGGQEGPINYDETTKEWTVVYFLEYGEIESIDEVWLNGEAPKSGVTITKYTGQASQTADSDVANVIAGYADDYVYEDPHGPLGVAYLVIRYHKSKYETWPTVLANVKGLKIPNRRKLNGASRYTGNGTDTFGAINTPIILTGDFTQDLSFTREDRGGSHTILPGNGASASDYVSFNAADHATAPDALNVHYGGALLVFDDALAGVAASEDVRVKVELVGTSLAVYVNGVRKGVQGVTPSSFTISSIGAHDGGTLPMPAGMLIGKVRIQDDVTGQEWNWNMAEGSGLTCVNSHKTTEVDDYSITLNSESWTAVPQVLEYTENFAAMTADMLSNNHYGLRKRVDDYGAIDAMDANDDHVNGEPRRRGSYSMKTPRRTEDVVETLRGYASCFAIRRGNVYYLKPDKPEKVSMEVTPYQMEEGTFEATKEDSTEIPTVVRAWYTDKTGDVWRERLCEPAMAAGVLEGTTQWRESQIRLDGADRHSQAHRECIERRNKLALIDLKASWDQTDEGWRVEQGDVLSVSHPRGLTNKQMRKLDPQVMISPGRWSMFVSEYDPAAYSDVVVDAPTYADGNLPSSGLNLRGSRISRQTTAPSDPEDGQMWVNPDDQERKKVYDGLDWVNVDESLVSVDADTIHNTAFQAAAFNRYLTDTETNGSFIITMPGSPTRGMRVRFVDAASYWDAQPIEIDGNGENIVEDSGNFIWPFRNVPFELEYINETIGWTLV